VTIPEGPRRLALLLGMLGAMIGAFVSYRELTVVIRHNTFKALVDSDFVRQEADKYLSDVQQKRSEYFEIEKECASQSSANARKLKSVLNTDQLAGQCASKEVGIERDLRRIDRVHSEVNSDKIKLIDWIPNYAIESIDVGEPWPRRLDIELIETQDGGEYEPGNVPSSWNYLLILFSPFLGFFAFWSGAHSVLWVRSGFEK
jgi:hypothetical protein